MDVGGRECGTVWDKRQRRTLSARRGVRRTRECRVGGTGEPGGSTADNTWGAEQGTAGGGRSRAGDTERIGAERGKAEDSGKTPFVRGAARAGAGWGRGMRGAAARHGAGSGSCRCRRRKVAEQLCRTRSPRHGHAEPPRPPAVQPPSLPPASSAGGGGGTGTGPGVNGQRRAEGVRSVSGEESAPSGLRANSGADPEGRRRVPGQGWVWGLLLCIPD